LGGPRDRSYATVPLAYSPPAEYVVEMEVERIQGGGLIVGLAVEDRQFHLILDAFCQPSGLSNYTGPPGLRPDIRRIGAVLRNNHKHAVQCTVKKGSIKVVIDAEVLLDYRGPVEHLSLHPRVRVPEKRCLFLGGTAGRFRIQKFELTPLTGHGRMLLF